MSSKAILTMNRTEVKYILSPEQVTYLKEQLQPYMEVDEYGLTTIASLYYDTPDYRLIRTSLEKPSFKEKIRLRSYGTPSATSPVYLQLKRKSLGIVYKRRAATTISETNRFFSGQGDVPGDGQISREIRYFRDFYGSLVPSMMIIYDRIAYKQREGDLRLTIDFNPRYRQENLDLSLGMEGKSILPEGYAILEVKIQDACPLWLSRILDAGHIYKSSFSKYGEAYKKQLIHQQNTPLRRLPTWNNSSTPSSLPKLRQQPIS